MYNRNSEEMQGNIISYFNPILHGEGGEADSAHLQIVFFINSIRDAAEPYDLVTSSKI